MSRLETLSEYVQKIVARMQSGSRSEQNTVLIREIAELRMQIRAISNSVAALASYQEIADQLGPRDDDAPHPALPRSLQIDAAQHLQLLDGFYALEYTPAGQAFRWTGPMRRFRFLVWIDRTAPVDVRLSVIAPGNLANIRNSRLFVDGAEYQAAYSDTDRAFTVPGIAPRGFFGVSIFEFELAGFIDDKDPSDTRELGVPFLTFEAVAQDIPGDVPHG